MWACHIIINVHYSLGLSIVYLRLEMTCTRHGGSLQGAGWFTDTDWKCYIYRYVLGTKVQCVYCTELAYGLAFRYSCNHLLPHTRIMQKELLDLDWWLLRIRTRQEFTLYYMHNERFDMLLNTGKCIVSYRGAVCELNAFTEAMRCLSSGYDMELWS